MTITRIQSTAPVREFLVGKIAAKLRANSPVLFIASGGSTAPVAAGVCADLTGAFADRRKILKLLMSVTLADERYGPEGHPDSNWRLLLEKGLEPKTFASFPILKPTSGAKGEEERDTMAFADMLTDAAARREHDSLYVVGLFGIGEDGHTAGILPGSPAAAISVNDSVYATSYRSAIFHRITITPAFFRHIDLAVALAVGEKKRGAIDAVSSDGPATEPPARLISFARESVLYTDQTTGEK